MPRFVVEYGKDTPPARDDGRLDADAFHRNYRPILDVLLRVLADATGNVIEVGSGTGQHVVAFAQAFPRLTWWPTDPTESHLRSIAAWRKHSGAANVMEPVALDAAESDWRLGATDRPPAIDIAAIVCLNVVHIAPWTVAEGLFRAAGRYLKRDGCLVLYGPYAIGGAHTAPSNAAFDAALRAKNPQWGVRDVTDMETLAKANSLRLTEAVPMPANNQTLIVRFREPA